MLSAQDWTNPAWSCFAGFHQPSTWKFKSVRSYKYSLKLKASNKTQWTTWRAMQSINHQFINCMLVQIGHCLELCNMSISISIWDWKLAEKTVKFSSNQQYFCHISGLYPSSNFDSHLKKLQTRNFQVTETDWQDFHAFLWQKLYLWQEVFLHFNCVTLRLAWEPYLSGLCNTYLVRVLI